ncbi:MAG: LamG domain-containing protein [Candidatus Nanopelagicales bacterium]
MRPRWSEGTGRLALVAALVAAVLAGTGTGLGSSAARFTDPTTARWTGSTKTACTPGNPLPPLLASPAYLPTLWWRFDTTTGATTVNDLTGHGNTGTVVNAGLTFGTANAGLIACDSTYAMRQPGAAASTGFVVAATPRTAPTSWTVATWVRSTSLTGGRILGFGDSAATGSTVHDRALLFDRSGRPVLHVKTSTGNLLLTGPARVTDNAVHLLVGTFSGSVAKLYVDGALVATSLPVTPAAPYAGYWRAGWDQNVAALIPTSRNQATVRQDEVAVWDGRVLGASEIDTIWRSNHW